MHLRPGDDTRRSKPSNALNYGRVNSFQRALKFFFQFSLVTFNLMRPARISSKLARRPKNFDNPRKWLILCVLRINLPGSVPLFQLTFRPARKTVRPKLRELSIPPPLVASETERKRHFSKIKQVKNYCTTGALLTWMYNDGRNMT